MLSSTLYAIDSEVKALTALHPSGATSPPSREGARAA
jgi:hypothetical protein